MIALYLSKTYHNNKPVAFLDTEKGSDFLLPYYEMEGVPMLQDKTRAFVDLRNAHAEALKAGACVLITDSLTHFWTELLKTVKGNARRLDIKKIGEAKEQWSVFTENFEISPIHWLVAGRLGHDWDNVDVEDEDGNIKTELLKGGTKMKAEGDFSYEPDLVLELGAADDPDAADYKRLSKGGRVKKIASKQIHTAIVKKCRVRALNGQLFSWPDREYKQGDYKKIADCFLPYFDFLNVGGEHKAFDASRTSQGLVDEANNRDFFHQKQRREIALEEIKGSLGCVWTAATGKDAAVKLEVINELFQTHSWTAVEKLDAEALEYGARVCVRMKNLAITKAPADRDGLMNLVKQAKDEIHDEQRTPVNGAPREVVGVMDQGQELPF